MAAEAETAGRSSALTWHGEWPSASPRTTSYGRSLLRGSNTTRLTRRRWQQHRPRQTASAFSATAVATAALTAINN